jgi:hypothetical protein
MTWKGAEAQPRASRSVDARRESPGDRQRTRLYNRRVPTLLPFLIAIHVGLALALLVPSLLLPFALRRRSVAAGGPGGLGPSEPGGFLLTLQTRGTPIIGLGLAVTGVGLLATLGFDLLAKPWLFLGLAIYGVNLVLAFFVQRPALRGLLGLRAAGDAATWAIRARRQRYLSYVMAGLIGGVGFLMSTKPLLW